MGIGDIITGHKPAPTKSAESAERKERVEEIVKELVPEAPKKTKGRPRKDSTEKLVLPPKTPPRSNEPPESTPEQIADGIANKAAVRRLAIYCKRFPQFAPPPSYNPLLHSAAQNKLVVEAIREAVRAEVEFLTAPTLISDSIKNGEKMATVWAMTHPDHQLAPAVASLHQAANAILSDPALDLDIGLLECEMTGFMPESPMLRILINVVRVLSNVWSDNQVRAQFPAPAPDKYAEF